MDTRPTADRLRETLFNVLTQGAVDRVADGAFLDLYAGSGAVGIEAVSRGAAQVTFVEQASGALTVLQKNLQVLGISRGVAQVEKRNVGRYLRGVLEKPEAVPFRAVFLDPPYEMAAEYESCLGMLGGDAALLLAADAIVVAEHRRKNPLKESYGRLERTRVIEQGDAALSFYALT
jgi:16S rRNA (guanine(966)-N(2))-methyltransferase RsmD